jgi:hypothetical protein
VKYTYHSHGVFITFNLLRTLGLFAELFVANAALSQLSYGPILHPGWESRGEKRPQCVAVAHSCQASSDIGGSATESA